MNFELFKLINDLANNNDLLDQIMLFMSKDLPFFFMAVVVFLFITGMINQNLQYRKIAFSTIVFTLMNLVFSFLIGCIYYVDRPFVHNQVHLLYPHNPDASFPSDHATGTMSIALGMGKYNRVLSGVLMGLSILVGFSRIYVGHHYPMDIVGAYLLVFVSGFVYNKMLRDKVEQFYERFEVKMRRQFSVIKSSD